MNPATIHRAAGALLLCALPAAAQDSATGPNVSRICLAPAVVEAAPNGMDAVSAVSAAFSTFLSGPTLAAKPLTARLQSQVREEAKLNECRFLLLPTVKHTQKTGGGMLGKMVGGAVQQGAWAATGAAAGSVVGTVVAGAAAGAASSTINDYATASRVKDELTLSYQLEGADGQVLVRHSEKRTAKADGEDLLTPLAQKASEAIAAAVAKGGNSR